MEKTKSEFASFEKKDIKLKQDHKNYKSNQKKLEKAIETNTKKIKSLKQKIVKSKHDEENAKKTMEKIKPDLAQAEATVEVIYA